MRQTGVKDILVRNVEVSTIDKLKARAKWRGRSLQAEMLDILNETAARPEPLSELEVIRKIRASNTKVNKTNSVDLLREDRNR